MLKRSVFFKRLAKVSFLPLVLIVFMAATNPRELPVVFLLVPGGLIFGSLYILFDSIAIKRLSRQSHVSWAQRLKPLLLATVLTLVLLLQSLGQLTAKDLLLLGFFGLLLTLYVRRTASPGI